MCISYRCFSWPHPYLTHRLWIDTLDSSCLLIHLLVRSRHTLISVFTRMWHNHPSFRLASAISCVGEGTDQERDVVMFLGVLDGEGDLSRGYG